MNVFMFQINDKMFGFTVVAIVARDAQSAMAELSRQRLDVNFTDAWRPGFTRLVDECRATKGQLVSFSFQE